ncbi:UNVERIFIED_ORG: hypothetical protein M2348_003555 [Sphingomonas sp. R1F5B]
MAFDLRNALLRKEEYESARLTAFEFAETVRALKAMAADRALHPRPLLDAMVEQGLASALTMIARQAGQSADAVEGAFLRARARARADLIALHGDPSPVRLG